MLVFSKSLLYLRSHFEKKIGKNIKRIALILDKISDFRELFDQYFCNEKELIYLLDQSIFDVYKNKKIISINIEKQLIYELKNGKITPFKMKKKYQKEIKKNLISRLERRRNEIFLSKNNGKIKDFYRDFLGDINRFFIIKIEEESVFLELKSITKKVPERLVFIANIDDFLDQDMIAIKHNFVFFIKNIEVKNEKIIVKMTRKRTEIIEKEIANVFDFIAKRYEKEIDYKIDFVDFKNKRVVIFVDNKTIESILKSVKKVIKSRLGFDIFWKIRKEIR